jgi:hypothetical protein
VWISAFTGVAAPFSLRTMLFLAELYWPRGALIADVARLARAGAVRAGGDGLSIRFIQAICVPHDECCFILYQCDSADAVLAAGARAGLEFDRVSAAQAAS